MKRLLLLCVLAAWLGLAHAGVMTKADLEAAFPDALRIGDKDSQVPVWPITKLDGPIEKVVAYVFESIDLAPIPGFAGVPFDLLIALDGNGQFLEVRVLSQHEPVFLDGLGPEPLFRFVEQYKGKSLRQNLKVVTNVNRGGEPSSVNVQLDGVTKATASLKIVNETVLAAALKVARAKLGYATRGSAEAAQVRMDGFTPLGWQQLVDRGYISHLRLTQHDVDAAFAGSIAEGSDPTTKPEDSFAELWLAYLNVPSIGRNLLGAKAYGDLMARLEPGQHAILALGAGPYSFAGEDFVRGSTPDRLLLRQDDLPVDLRDMDVDPVVALPGLPAGIDTAKVFRIGANAGFDPARAWHAALRVTRSKGMLMPERVNRDFELKTQLPAEFFIIPEAVAEWKAVWRDRAADVAVIAAALTLLAVLLARPRWVTASARRLAALRLAFLAFTLGFIGWHAEAQLSIVTLTGLIKGIAAGDLAFFLYDPPTAVVGGFALVTLLVWGRGTFCGWLCPFGALQEFVALAARRLRLPEIKLAAALDRRLTLIKYPVLALIVVSAIAWPVAAEKAVAVEPFKTAITLAFVAAWPAVLYAALLLVAGALSYKPFCRYLCPLGASLALLGRLRRWNWLPRRPACGQPCQLCRHRCLYNAIERSGAIRYDECFQCLDCVAIYHDPARCAPLLLQARKGRRAGPE